MILLDAEIEKTRALVIDGNPTSRSVLVGMLRDFGVGTIVQCSRATDARQHLEHGAFDIVLCDYHFDTHTYTGQDLMDDLRRAQLLPFSTVFVMVTGESSYAKVAEAAESALDSYLLKPHTALALGERLQQARHRKKTLKPIFDAVEANEFEKAAMLCLQRFDSRQSYWLYAARIGAELLLRIGRHDDAKQLYDAVIQNNALPWARLGIARSEIGMEKLPAAKRTLEGLIADNPSYADAYDVMGRVHVEQGDLGHALTTYRKATELTPNSLTRLQKQGMLAFYTGGKQEALQSLDRAMMLGLRSKMFDYQSVVLIAFLSFDKGDTKLLQRCLTTLSQQLESAPKSKRLQRFFDTAQVLRHLTVKQAAPAVDGMKRLAGQIKADHFDFEAATNLVSLITRIGKSELELPDAELWLTTIARRFCATKATTELLMNAARDSEDYRLLVRQEQHRITEMAEQAMTHGLAGDHSSAVKSLLVQGAQTLNPRLIDMAAGVLSRHGPKIENAEELAKVCNELKSRFCTQGTQISLGRTSRAEGAMSLRGDGSEEEDEGAAPLKPAPPKAVAASK